MPGYYDPFYGVPGPAGPAGAAGLDGKTIYHGAGAPAGGLGVDGDLYLDTANNLLYGPKAAGVWGAGIAFSGLTGPAGADGANGVDGKTVLNGAGAPGAGLGVNGDFYIDTTGHLLYGPKTAGAWGAGVSLVGVNATLSTIEDEGVALAARATMNFVGAGVTAADAGGKTVVTIPGGGGTGTIYAVVDGGGVALGAGIMGDVSLPFAGTITGYTLLADQAGNLVLDLWKDTYANFPPTVADTITAAAKPTLAAAAKTQDSTLTGWSKAIVAGDVLRFVIDSVATITRFTLAITYAKA
jgi:hypothetical protein